MKTLHLLTLFLLLGILGCHHAGNPQALSIQGGKKNNSSIRISRVSAEVNITGRMAETTLDFTFANTSNRIIEAMLDLPLPEGASISRYALEVNGKMREGVIVDKQLGRVAFENTIRQNIDPGLLEKTKGNRFRTRIYPVPAMGTKRVLLSYIEPLKGGGSQYGSMRYTLPVASSRNLKQFQLTINHNPQHCSVGPREKTSGLVETPEGRLRMSKSNSRIKPLEFLITPKSKRLDTVIQKGRDGRRYFHLTDRIPSGTQITRANNEKILLVWDASHSAISRDLKRELALLDAYFQTQRNTQVDLRILRDVMSKTGRFEIEDGDWQDLRNTLTSLQADGATRIDRLKFPQKKYDAVFYFGDGLATLGDVPAHWGSTPVFAINSSANANHLLLSRMAKSTGGSYVNMTHLSQTSALKKLTQQTLSLIKVSGTGISETFIHSDGLLATVSGRLDGTRGTLKLHYGTNGRISSVKSVHLDSATHGSSGNAAARLWAQEKVNALSLNKRKNRSQIVAIAQTHLLVTDFTSLIVLDRIEDYVRYRIVPPEAEMRKDYHQRIKGAEAYDGKKSADMAEVYTEWQELVKWHQTSFPRPVSKRRPSSPDNFSAKGVISPAPPAPAVMFMGGGDGPSTISNISTAGLRSGDFAITRNSISALLNNPSRATSEPSSSISIKGWQPDTPYTKALEKAHWNQKPLMPVYYQWKKKYLHSTGFYLDVADFFISHQQPEIARRILSNLAEISPESPELLRVLAHRYTQIGEYQLAELLFREILDMRTEEPQSHRDLALILVRRKQYQEAADLLWKVINRQWNLRFDGIQMIALNEWNQLIRMHSSSITIKPSQQKFRYLLDADIRVLISWDTDNSDMDLWVTDPKEEKCYYANKFTKMGGRISDDMTGGRGPEEFLIRKAPTGKYKIQANFYGTRQQTLIGPTTLHATVTTNWGRPNEKHKHLTFRLGKSKEVVLIGEIEFER